MSIIKIIENQDSVIAIWKIEESESSLAALVDDRLLENNYYLTISNPAKRKECLASRALLTELLKLKNIDYGSLVKDEFGKPVLNDCNLHIGLSHTKGYTAAILSKHSFTGVDIENNSGKAFKIRAKFMNELELQLTDNDIEVATLFWSAKESVYKAYGKKKLSFKDDILVKSISATSLEIQFNENLYKLKWILNPEFVLSYL